MTGTGIGSIRLRVWAIALLLLGWQASWGALLGVDKAGGSWGYFERAVHALFGAHGLDLYARHPDLQFGPVSTVLAAPFVWLGDPAGPWVAMAAMAVLGVVLLLWATGDDVGQWRPNPLRFMGFGVFAMPVWADLAIRNAHFDDVIALAFGCLALHAIRRGNAAGAGVLLGLAVDAKPWAVAFVVVLLALPRREWPRSVAAFVVTVTAAWLPFFLAAPESLAALRFALKVDDDSVLALLGLAGQEAPGWVRPSQLALGLVLGLLLIRARRHEAIFFVVLAGRILLDPAAHNYYASGAVLAAVLADRALRHRGPWLTLATALVLWLPHRMPGLELADEPLAQLRLGWAVGVLAVVTFAALHQRRAEVLRANRRLPRHAARPPAPVGVGSVD